MGGGRGSNIRQLANKIGEKGGTLLNWMLAFCIFPRLSSRERLHSSQGIRCLSGSKLFCVWHSLHCFTPLCPSGK